MARIGGYFPFPYAQVAEGTTRVALVSGGMYYIPSGQFLLLTDAHTLLQYFESQTQSWQTLLGHSSGANITIDGVNYRAINDSGIVTSTTISNAGSGMTNGIGSVATGVTAAIAAPSTANLPTATLQVIIGGTVAAPTITQGGTGFTVPPVIVIDPPPVGGIQATATCTINIATGAISTVSIGNAGAGYTGTPNFWIIPQPTLVQSSPTGGLAAGLNPPPGIVHPQNALPGINQNTSSATGALLTSNPLTGSGTLTGLILANPGGGYTTASPAVTFTGGAGGVAASVTVGTTSLTQPSTITLAPRIND